MQKHEKNQILANFKEGDSHEVTVQEVDEEYKKIILMMDLGLDEVKAKEEPEEAVEESEPEKIDIPQDIIDNVSEDNSDLESVEETEELAEKSKEDSEASSEDSLDVDNSKDE